MSQMRLVSSENFRGLTDWSVEVQRLVYREKRWEACGAPVLRLPETCLTSFTCCFLSD